MCSKSPKPINVLRLSHLYIRTNLVEIHTMGQVTYGFNTRVDEICGWMDGMTGGRKNG